MLFIKLTHFISKTHFLSVYGVLAMFLPTALWAQSSEQDDEPQLERITVQGRKTTFSQLQDSAKAVELIDTEAAQKLTVDLGEVMARTPGVSVRRSGGLGSQMRFSLNGLTGDQVRFFVDGVPLAMSGYASDISSIPVNLIEHVEIYHGVVPVEFGADALGGAVNLVSNKLADANGTVSQQIGDFGTQRTTLSLNHVTSSGLFARINSFYDKADNDYEVDVNVIDDKGALSHRTSVKRFHDQYATRGAIVDVGLTNQTWADLLQVSLYGSRLTKDIQHNVNMSVPYGEVTSRRKGTGFNVRYKKQLFEQLSLNATMGSSESESHFLDIAPYSYNWFGEQIITNFPHPGEINQEAHYRVDYQDSFARFNLNWASTDNQQVTLLMAPTWHQRSGDNLLLTEDEFDADNAKRSIFSNVTGIEHNVSFFDQQLKNIFFIKHYHLELEAQKVINRRFYDANRTIDRLGWGNAIRYDINPWLYVKGSYEKATRLPSPTETLGDGVTIESNFDLKEEVSDNFNLSLALNNVEIETSYIRANLNVFIRDIDNLIKWTPAGRGARYQNIGAAKSEGLQGGVGWTSPTAFVDVELNSTWMNFVNTTDNGRYKGKRIPNEPYFYVNSTLRFNWQDLVQEFDALSLSVHSRYVETFSLVYEGLGNLNPDGISNNVPSQFSHAIGLTYSTDIADVTMSLSLEAQNITDERLYDFDGVQRPGRAFHSKLIVEF